MNTTANQSEYLLFTTHNKYINYFICTKQNYDRLVQDINHFYPRNTFEVLGKQLLITVLLPSKKISLFTLFQIIRLGLYIKETIPDEWQQIK